MVIKEEVRATVGRPRIEWGNLAFLTIIHLSPFFAIWYAFYSPSFSWFSVALGGLWFCLCGLSITAGYHRLFSHRAYEGSALLELFYLLFGAASVQNSALKWCADHRRHHRFTDTAKDPYNINKGFWWAHVLWVVTKECESELNQPELKDLGRNRLVAWQSKYYVPLAILVGGVAPFCLGLIWGDPVGALLFGGFVRLVVQYHMTFSVNSVAHTLGKRTFSKTSTARDSFLTAMVSFGEGYHSFHHRFPSDYRNGHRWMHFDPSKWWIRSLAWVRQTRKLNTTPKERIREAKEMAKAA